MSDLVLPQCQVCNLRQSVGVASSPLGPMSFAYCRVCLDVMAEPLWLVLATIDCVGGPEHTAKWVKEIRSFKDGAYLEWDEFLVYYVPGSTDQQGGDVPP